MLNKKFIEEWEMELPDGTLIKDEIEYGYQISIMGVELTPQRNRRCVIFPDGEETYTPVPENFEQNRKDLFAIVTEWTKAKEEFTKGFGARQKNYLSYKEWLEKNLDGTALSSLLFSTAKINHNLGL